MGPQPIANRNRIIIYALVIALLFVVEGIALWRLATGQSTAHTRIAFIAMLLWFPVAATPLISIVFTLRTERHLRAAMDDDERIAPRVITQPNPTQALRPGERLILTRTMRPWIYWGRLAFTLLFLTPVALIMGTTTGVVFLDPAFPRTTGWLLTMLYHPDTIQKTLLHPPPLNPLEWLVALTPLGLAVMAITALWIEAIPSRRQVITLDDTGLTVQWFWRRSNTIPWNDIRLFLLIDADASQVGTYWLRGAQHGLILALGEISPAPTPQGKPRQPLYTYAGGPDGYRAQVQRLLATVTARAGVPLRLWTSPPRGASPTHRALPAAFTISEAQTLPRAADALQPTPADIADARSLPATERISLRASLSIRVLAQGPKWPILFYGFITLMASIFPLVAHGASMNTLLAHLMSLGTVGLIAAGVGFGAVMSITGAVNAYRNIEAPAVVAGPDGLALKGYGDKSLGVIAWPDVRGWAILRPEPWEPQIITYAVFSDNQVLEWAELPDAKLAGRHVRGDRHEAYHATARRLHALIAARTGLLLQEMKSRPSQ